MGLFDRLRDGYEWLKEKAQDAFDWVKDKLSRKKYDEDNIEDQVDVDAALAEYRDRIKDDEATLEKECMDTISQLFSELMRKSKDKFPDLVEIIKSEQKKAEDELKGTIMKYVKEHLSKNNSRFVVALKMSPCEYKDQVLDDARERVFEEAREVFDSKLKKYAEHLLEMFTSRLNIRIATQEEQMNKRIKELEKLQVEAENNQIDIEALKEKSVPVMESAECIIHMFEMEM